jgi:hypothetical protein
MKLRNIASGGVAAVAVAGLLGIAPAAAFTHHPATPAEIKQTDDLNAQSLAAARGGAAPTTFIDRTNVMASTPAGQADQNSTTSATAPADANAPSSDSTSTDTKATPDAGATPPSGNTPSNGQ